MNWHITWDREREHQISEHHARIQREQRVLVELLAPKCPVVQIERGRVLRERRLGRLPAGSVQRPGGGAA